MELKELVTDEQLMTAFGNADFGDVTQRDVVKFSLLQYACGFTTGRTSTLILQELGLITIKLNLTKKGRNYLFDAFKRQTTF